jgi:uncharacterized membrane protein YkgB
MAAILGSWSVFPAWSLLPLALTLGVLSLLSGIGLLAGGRRRRWGALGSVILCALVVILEFTALVRHIPVENVGTFGIYLNDRLNWPLFARDTGLLALALLLRRFQNRRATDHRTAAAPVRWAARR